MRGLLCPSVASFLMLVLVGPGALAQDSVCEEYGGAAWGLCNAYCEAMQCGGLEQEASGVACDRVADNFRALTGVDPPCTIRPLSYWGLDEEYLLGLCDEFFETEGIRDADVCIVCVCPDDATSGEDCCPGGQVDDSEEGDKKFYWEIKVTPEGIQVYIVTGGGFGQYFMNTTCDRASSGCEYMLPADMDRDEIQ